MRDDFARVLASPAHLLFRGLFPSNARLEADIDTFRVANDVDNNKGPKRYNLLLLAVVSSFHSFLSPLILSLLTSDAVLSLNPSICLLLAYSRWHSRRSQSSDRE